MYTLHGKRSSRKSSSRALVFKNEDAKGHRQERNVKSFTWEKDRFNGRPWNIPQGRGVTRKITSYVITYLGLAQMLKKNLTVNFWWKEVLLVSRAHGRRWWTGRKTKPRGVSLIVYREIYWGPTGVRLEVLPA